MNYKYPVDYKKRTLLTLVITATALLVCAAAFFLKQKPSLAVQGSLEESYTSYYSPKPAASQEIRETPAPSLPAPSPSAEPEKYLITIYSGKIGVFREGEASPMLITETDVYLLPKEDIDILRQGIRVTGFSAVKSVLEDYNS